MTQENNRRLWLMLIFIFWLVFFARSVLYWGEAELFSRIWWFDEINHAIFGFVGGLTLIYLIRNYAAAGIFTFAGQKIFGVIVIAIITLLGMFWEGAELWWDLHLRPSYFNWLAIAQKDSADTTIDLLTNSIFAFLAVLLYKVYNYFYFWIYPDESEKEDIEAAKSAIKLLTKNIRERRRENLTQLWPTLKELFDNFREKE
ncbi:MAG: hypothetical protein HYV52_00415 [Parcubacteria group bacterium]|nr:hypothetical protein [Parcubacteria group bacterium]